MHGKKAEVNAIYSEPKYGSLVLDRLGGDGILFFLWNDL